MEKGKTTKIDLNLENLTHTIRLIPSFTRNGSN